MFILTFDAISFDAILGDDISNTKKEVCKVIPSPKLSLPPPQKVLFVYFIPQKPVLEIYAFEMNFIYIKYCWCGEENIITGRRNSFQTQDRQTTPWIDTLIDRLIDR